MILGAASGLVETITDAVSIHSIKKAEYAKRLARNRLGYVTLMDHFKSVSQTRSTGIVINFFNNIRLMVIRLLPSLLVPNAILQSLLLDIPSLLTFYK